MARLIFVHLVLRLCGISSVFIYLATAGKSSESRTVSLQIQCIMNVMMLIAHDKRKILASVAIPVLHQPISADV